MCELDERKDRFESVSKLHIDQMQGFLVKEAAGRAPAGLSIIPAGSLQIRTLEALEIRSMVSRAAN